jgi:hypothetical protein
MLTIPFPLDTKTYRVYRRRNSPIATFLCTVEVGSMHVETIAGVVHNRTEVSILIGNRQFDDFHVEWSSGVATYVNNTIENAASNADLLYHRQIPTAAVDEELILIDQANELLRGSCCCSSYRPTGWTFSSFLQFWRWFR